MNSKVINRATWCYERLLRLYPKEHRVEYGECMAQLFRDECRDSWNQARWNGLVVLWIRTLIDLSKTVVLEHLSNLKGRNMMPQNIFQNPRKTFKFTALLSFIIVYSTIVVFTLWLLPEKYGSVVRIELEKIWSPSLKLVSNPYFLENQYEFIKSQMVLEKVITDLNLDQTFARRLGAEKLTLDDTCILLQKRIKIHQVRGSSVIEIWVYDSDRMLAAQIANQIVNVYKSVAPEQSNAIDRSKVRVLDVAKPALHPSFPNRPLNLIMGFCGSLGLALFAGAAAAFVVWMWGKVPTIPRAGQIR